MKVSLLLFFKCRELKWIYLEFREILYSLKRDLITIPEFLKERILLVHGFYTLFNLIKYQHWHSENVYYVDDSNKLDLICQKGLTEMRGSYWIISSSFKVDKAYSSDLFFILFVWYVYIIISRMSLIFSIVSCIKCFKKGFFNIFLF